MSELEAAAVTFAGARKKLFGVAYRILGSAAEAEDVVQDAWLRWQSADRGAVLDPTAFLVTTTTRLAINVLQSARSRRETYVGPWLPEPVDTSSDPELGAARGESLELAVLLLLERLGPTERAAYVLAEAFDYSSTQIAEMLAQSEANVRQLVSRARKRLAQERKGSATAEDQKRLLTALVSASRTGDVTALERLLAPAAASHSDSDGLFPGAARKVVTGAERVARLIAGFASKPFWPGSELRWVEANGQPALLVVQEGVVRCLVAVEASANGVEQVFWVLNPAKLAAISSALTISD